MDEFCLIILGGEVAPVLREFAVQARLVFCADSGAEQARRVGLRCDAIIGDLDSLSLETRHYFEAIGTPILRVPNQANNDFEKTLDFVLTKWGGDVYVLGMTGGRLDHTLSNLSVMMRYTDRFTTLRAMDAHAEYRFLTQDRNTCSISCSVGTTISLLPFGEASGIITENLLYPLARETLQLGSREGLSNRATGQPVRISIGSGALLVAVLQDYT